MKHWEQKLATYAYNYCSICDIPIYFCNIRMKDLQHPDETSETLETYSCNMCFQRAMSPCSLVDLLGGLGKHLLGNLGEHLCKVREHLLGGLGSAPLTSTCLAPGWAARRRRPRRVDAVVQASGTEV